MKMLRHVGATVAAVLFITIAAGCTHKTSPSAQISDGLAPFTFTRNQTVALVAHNKRTLGAEDINTLSVAYTDLQEKSQCLR